jgi:hypothetical protein
VCYFATLEDLHPSRVLTAWRDVNTADTQLIGFSDDESGAEEGKQKDVDEEGDNEREERGGFTEGQFDSVRESYQVGDDEGEDDADDDRGAWYDDEDRETWPE